LRAVFVLTGWTLPASEPGFGFLSEFWIYDRTATPDQKTILCRKDESLHPKSTVSIVAPIYAARETACLVSLGPYSCCFL
jgi:hypothetical protein